MREPAHSDNAIVTAIKTLQSSGKAVTPYTLQRLLGSGSTPYFRHAINRLCQMGAVVIEGRNEHTEVLDAISNLLNDATAKIEKDAAAQYQKERTRLEGCKADLQQRLQNEVNESAALRNQLAQSQSQLTETKHQLAQTTEKLHSCEKDKAVVDAQLASAKASLADANETNKKLTENHYLSLEQSRAERVELLAQLNEITKTSRESVNQSSIAEQGMRTQLMQAQKDVLKYISENATLSAQLKELAGGASLLKRYKNWEQISALCLAGSKRSKPAKTISSSAE